MVERHMTPEMDVQGNHKMDWFFDQYVYGTALPSYNFQSSFSKDANGDTVLSFKLAQSNVGANFRMLVPLYLELADGRTAMMGRIKITGNTTVEQQVPLKGLKEMPSRAVVNYFDDVLASPN